MWKILRVAGTYDPIPKPPIDGEGKPWKDIKLDISRAKYWLGVGAQPSDPAWRLLTMVRYIHLLALLFLDRTSGFLKWKWNGEWE